MIRRRLAAAAFAVSTSLLAASTAWAQSCPGPAAAPGFILADRTTELRFAGADIADAHGAFDLDGRPSVVISLCRAAAERLAEFSLRAVGRQTRFIVGGERAADPIFTSPILNGQLQISGDFTTDDAAALAGRILGSVE